MRQILCICRRVTSNSTLAKHNLSHILESTISEHQRGSLRAFCWTAFGDAISAHSMLTKQCLSFPFQIYAIHPARLSTTALWIYDSGNHLETAHVSLWTAANTWNVFIQSLGQNCNHWNTSRQQSIWGPCWSNLVELTFDYSVCFTCFSKVGLHIPPPPPPLLPCLLPPPHQSTLSVSLSPSHSASTKCDPHT